MTSRKKQLLRRGFEIGVLGLAAAYVFGALGQGWQTVLQHLGQLNWLLLAAALGCFFAYFVCRVIAWGAIIGGLGYPLTFGTNARLWLVSELGRYIPGSVWSFLGRVYLAEKKGVPKLITTTALAAEVYLLVGSAALFGISFLALLPFGDLSALRWLLLASPLLIVFMVPHFFHWALGLIGRFTKLAVADKPFAIKRFLGVFAVMAVGWGLYGYGSYLVLRACNLAISANWVWLASMFVVVWLIGYLSFVTPMGLGVREGATIGLLLPLIGGSLAGLVAVLTRLWLICAELVVLVGLGGYKLLPYWRWAWRKVISALGRHRYGVLLTVLMLLFMLYFGTLICLWQANYVSNHYDLGIMDQVVWNTAHGNFLQMTDPLGVATISRFSIHADPILALLAPLYWFAASPYTLILVQVMVVALGAVPLYWLGKQVSGSKRVALLVAAAYLLFPPLQWNTAFAFHGVTLADTFVLFAFYYLYNNKWGRFALFAALTLLCKETMALVIAGMGIYTIISKRRWWLGLGTIGVSIAWFLVLMLYIIPGNRMDGTTHFALSYYSQFGTTVGAIFKNLLLKPWLWISMMWRNQFYFGFFLLPTGVVPLLAPGVLALALPTFAINILSNDPGMQSIYYQYTSTITAFVFIALLFGIVRLRRKVWPKLSRWLRVRRGALDICLFLYLAACMAIAIGLWAPIPGDGWDIGAVFSPAAHLTPAAQQYLDHLSDTIPHSASISVTASLQPHFSERQHVYQFPLEDTEADYVITQAYSGVEPDVYPSGFITAAIADMEHNPAYQIIYKKASVEVFKHR